MEILFIYVITNVYIGSHKASYHKNVGQKRKQPKDNSKPKELILHKKAKFSKEEKHHLIEVYNKVYNLHDGPQADWAAISNSFNLDMSCNYSPLQLKNLYSTYIRKALY